MSIFVCDIEVLDDDVRVLHGAEAFKVFKDFIETNFIWRVSGVDWTKSQYTAQMNWARYNKEEFLEFTRDNGFSGKKYLNFEQAGYGDFLVEADIKQIAEILHQAENFSDIIHTLDFWIFDLEELSLLEVYHDGTVTLAK